MKRIITIFSIIALGLGFVSCNQDLLEIPQKGVITIDNFYQTDEDAENALVAMYQNYATGLMTTDYPAGNYIPWYALFNVCGDDFLAAGKEYGSSDFYGEMNEFRYDSQSTMVELVYSRYYRMIYYANLVIEHFKDGTSATMKRCVAEARTLRAYCHMMLAIGWGAAPLRTIFWVQMRIFPTMRAARKASWSGLPRRARKQRPIWKRGLVLLTRIQLSNSPRVRHGRLPERLICLQAIMPRPARISRR